MVSNVCSPNQEMRSVTDQYEPAAADLHNTTDARVWAEEFCKRFGVHDPTTDNDVDDPKGLMIGWFANAIETGSLHEARRRPKTERNPDPIPDAEETSSRSSVGRVGYSGNTVVRSRLNDEDDGGVVSG
jgi:hypothetical protein